ncbi:TonB-dependent receptor [Nonlabens sp. YIK11]|uniref:outer membrane beta-barrel protein n=1 Tax=Nonlabens sp. YIK11 TaxID=1453349 RepID=UPI0006DC44FC|nr:outer membrane beta-barrel family protein [Nonlabens sp. YIK11]KQC32340.1 TonB-dependent receptor [Nonlabens sp. YIK11]
MKIITLMVLLVSLQITAQHSIQGNLVDEQNQPVAYANALLFKMPDSTYYKGTTTDENGRFKMENIATGDYTFAASYVGYVTLSRKLTINNTTNLNDLILSTSTESLDGVTVTARRPTIEKRPDRLIFNVENTSLSTSNAANILKNTPGVFEMNGSYMVQNATAVIYINDRRVYITQDELNDFLRSQSGDNIKSVEVITNPSANYDAEGVAVININTSKGVSLGYKGSINGSYSIDELAKYQIGTSQFYKNNWVNIYANYSYNPRKDLKLDEAQVGFFNPDGSRSSRWFTDFEKVTESDAHNLNTAIDFTLDDSNDISISANYSANNNQDVRTDVETFILPSGSMSFDGFDTNSDLAIDRTTGFVNAAWNNSFNEGAGRFSLEGNYIFTDRDKTQDLLSTFFDQNGATTSTNSFFTDAAQTIDIAVAKADYENTVGNYLLKAGAKFSDVSSTSQLDFFDTNTGSRQFNAALSDRFIYDENIYAAYFQVDRDWDRWAMALGLRAEQTDVEGDSRSLGQVNTQEYFELFPNLSVTNQVSDNHSLTLSYRRSIERPRYESLNPFTYFINDNNVNTGNPNLRPAFTNKVNLNWNIKNQYFFDAYYTRTDNALAILPFQNNQTNVVNSQNFNMDYELQYSLDFQFYQFLGNSIIFQAQTSLFYMENEFTAIQSGGVKQKNDVTGLYVSTLSSINLSDDRTFSATLDLGYLSNILIGSYEFKNQITSGIGLRKSIWNNRAVITLDYDDIFLSQNQPLKSRYLNQDNEYLALPETNLITIGFTYNFGNFRLNNNEVSTPEDQERTNARDNSF